MEELTVTIQYATKDGGSVKIVKIIPKEKEDKLFNFIADI